ncbi:hypothetical protein ES708_28435 [subsurface metagenome]
MNRLEYICLVLHSTPPLKQYFADKWNEDEKLPLAFFDWINSARDTFCRDVLKKEKDLEMMDVLKENLGVNIKMDRNIDSKKTETPVYIKVNDLQNRRPWGNE